MFEPDGDDWEVTVLGEVLDWLQALPPPALVAAAGLLVLGECTLGVGLIVPGESGLLVAATTATTVPRFALLWAVVTVCAVTGDVVGYLIGRRYGARLRETRLVARYGARLWDRSADVLRRRGAWAVFFVRFLLAIRALTPAAAGSAGLRLRVFLPVAIAGASCWSALHIGLGVALGEAATRAEGAFSKVGYVVIGLLAALAVVLAVRARRASRAGVGSEYDNSDQR